MVAGQLYLKPDSALGLATGSTPLPMYRRLIALHRSLGLDFSALMGGRASVPEAWPPPFTIGGAPSALFDLGGGHFVRAHSAPVASAERVA